MNHKSLVRIGIIPSLVPGLPGIALGLMLLMSPTCSPQEHTTQGSMPTKLDFESKIQMAMDSLYVTAEDLGGATLGVILPNGRSYAFAVGLADMTTNTSMATDQPMLGGSTGKILVSAAIMQQVQSKRIDLDQKVQHYLGGEPWFYRIQNHTSVTIRQLLQHSSGISRYVFTEAFLEDVQKNPDRIWKPEELVSYVFDIPPLFVPGTDFSYADTNYILLGMILERVTRLTLYGYIQSHILEKHGLEHLYPQISRSIPRLPVGYNATDDPFYPGTVTENGVYKYNLQFEWAGGGFVCHVVDLAKAAKMIYEGQVFEQSLMPDFLQGIDAGELGGQWGLGVHITKTSGFRSYGHGGFFPGYITNVLYFPENGMAIAIQVNVSDREKLGLYKKIHSIIPLIISSGSSR